jgi:hypothetical protein
MLRKESQPVVRDNRAAATKIFAEFFIAAKIRR